MVFETKDSKALDIEIIDQQKLIEILHVLQPNFARALSRGEQTDYNFYKVDYPFGAEIIKNGQIYLPLANGESIALNDPMLPAQIANDLNFDPEKEDPLVLVLSNKSELYYRPAANRFMSQAIIEPGAIIGIPRATHITEANNTLPRSSLAWELNAGARSLMMLSKIADKTKYEKLSKSLKIKIDPPMPTENQYNIFTAIAKKCDLPWRFSLLFFPRQWINQVTKEKNLPIYAHLMQRQRASYNLWHNRTLLWSSVLSEVEKQKSLAYAPYVLSTAKQLFYIAAQSAVGFTPAINDDAAPISFLREAFANGYGLADENQSTIIMEPSHFNFANNAPIYYSLNYPILAEHKPDTFKGKSQITLLDELSRVVAAYKSSIVNNSHNINIPSDLAEVITTTDFEFFHSNPENYRNIQNSNTIAEKDQRFLFQQKSLAAENSSFFKGCIRIAHNSSF